MGARNQSNPPQKTELSGQALLEQFVDAARNCRDDEAETLSQLLTTENGSALLTSVRQTDNLDLRWWAIRALAICGDGSAVDSLAKVLEDPEPELRAVAALALGHIGQRLVIAGAEPVENSLPEELDSTLQQMAELLSDVEGTVRQAAADALVLLGGSAVPVLQKVLTTDPENARVRAAYALRKIGTRGNAVEETAPVLFQILNDSNYLVHTYAHEALDEMGLLDNVLVAL